MGSARVSNKPTDPLPMENTDKKSIKTLIKSIFQKKKDKKHDKKDEKEKIIEPTKGTKPEIDAVAAVLENFNKLNIKPRIVNKPEIKDPELDNFAFKIIDEHRNERIHSNSSEDSGFSDTNNVENGENVENPLQDVENDDNTDNTKKLEKKVENTDKCDQIVKDLENLGLDDEKKKKKLQNVFVSRGPVRTKVSGYSDIYPYPTQDSEGFRQINQINKRTLTGGQVIVNQNTDNILSEFQDALDNVQQNAQMQSDRDAYFKDVLEYIKEDSTKPAQNITTDYLNNLTGEKHFTENFMLLPETTTNIQSFDIENSILEEGDLSRMYDYVQKELSSISTTDYQVPTDYQVSTDYQVPTDYKVTTDYQLHTDYTYPTPPRSENSLSPMTFSPGLYPSNSEYTLSPERSPISNTDYEKYQEIPHFEEDSIDKKARERTASASSMTMKQFKDLQKEIVYNLSKKDCCQTNRKSCKELFQEYLQKIEMAERKNLCMKFAKMDLKTAYGVLLHIMLSFSKGSNQEELEMVLFEMICDRLLAHDMSLFVGDAGLNLLKSAALRCPHKPLLTRYLVQCIRTAVKSEPALVEGKEFIFHEVDALGDNLVIACARAGDRCADVLYEIVRSDGLPLFKETHANADGYTALHVACNQHSISSPRLHTVHVLLEHAHFDITHGDLKGRDTALHLAVYSTNCDLQLILLMFKQVDRKEWKSLAHWSNLSSKTPLDLARLATKSTARQNYPPEVLEFLKKCR